MIIRRFKDKLGDLLFGKELDHAYEMGIREGARYSSSLMFTKLYAKKCVMEMTKTQEIGYEKAIEVIREAKHEVRGKTGAWS